MGFNGDRQVLEIARSKARDHGLEIQFEQGMSFDLPHPTALLDIVLTSFMLHHLERDDKQKTAMEVFRVLRPGGQLFRVDFVEPQNCLEKLFDP